MMPLGELFVHVYVLVDDAPADGTVGVPRRPGPPPACSEAEVLTIGLVRHLPGRPSERAVLAELRRDGRLVPAWEIVPAAVDERAVADDLLADASPRGLLLDRGFLRRAGAAAYEQRGIRVLYAHGKADRLRLPAAVRRPVARLRNRVETTIGELTETLGLARHGAKTFRGLLARAAAPIPAHTLLRLRRV